MGEVPLSLHVTAKLKDNLEQEAQRQHVSADDIAEQAISWYIENQQRERQILRERAAEADKGVFVSSEAMLAWMEKRLKGEQAPPPQPDTFLKPRQP
jgi:predicted transcriptional regulator